MAEIDIYNYIEMNKKYYIYGTTDLGRFFYEKIMSKCGKECILGFLETDPVARKCFEKSVFSPNEIEKTENDVRIIIASVTHFEDMKNKLISEGVLDEQIIVPYKMFEYFKTLYGQKRENIAKVCFWPSINSEQLKLIKKISWFIPDRVEVCVWCDDEELKTQFSNNVSFKDIVDKNSVFDNSDIIFLWDTNSDNTEYEAYISKVYIVDPDFYLRVESLNYCKLYYSSYSNSEKKKYEEKSKLVFSELKKKCMSYLKARVFCSGPSMDEIYENAYEDSVNIICNSMVKGKEWLKRINPDILVFSDLNYFFSPTEYCKKFFEDVLDGQRLYNYYIFVYDYEVPLLLFHYPELSGKVIGIANDSKVFDYPSESQLKVKGTGNILTEIMIPLASALCDEIEIAGATGRNPDENFFWKHNGRMQYQDLMHTIFEMYPSLFRDQNYANYYEKHCQCMEELLKYGEKRGKIYINLTTSYIPALKKRTIKD